jgi:MFS family permease
MARLYAASTPWYRALNRNQWNALIGSNLGWVFDGYETYAVILTVGVALRQLLDPALLPSLPLYAGTLIGITLLGWGIGGMIGGIMADYLGRKRTMMLAILAYSLTTGLSALSWDWVSFLFLRFIVGIAIVSEWVTGAAITAELWPDRARGKGVGLMQCGLGIGFFLAAFLWLFVGGLGPDAWRIMYAIGVLPALLTLWIRRSIPESALWERSSAQRRAAAERLRSGALPDAYDEALTRFTLWELFATPELRRRTILAFLVSLATTVGFWGISTWVPPYIASVAAKAGLAAAPWASYAGMTYNLGAICGYVAFGFLADLYGRKPVLLTYLAGALVITPVQFLWAREPITLLLVAFVMGAFATGQYTWMSAWLPELFPTRLRATGAGFVFNAPRFIAWLGPLISGVLITQFGGYGNSAVIVGSIYILGLLVVPFLPETRGRPLPERV